MFRGILFGSVAFGAVFLIEKQLGTVFQDMRRYDKLRAMSGDSPLLVEGFKELLGFVMREERKNGDGGGGSLFDIVRKDVARYVTMRAM